MDGLFRVNNRKYFENLGFSPTSPSPSIEMPPVFYEKLPLAHLRYVYLGTSSTLLVTPQNIP